MLAKDYLENAQRLLNTIQETQMEAIQQAAAWISDSIAQGGVMHVFGSGHSHMSALEAHGRAGGLVPVQPLTDPAEGKAERLEGYASQLLSRWDVRPGEVVLIFSNSGINAVPIEMAMEAKRMGLKVVAITSMRHTQSAPARHSSGQKLYQVADLVIDNCGIVGDAAIEVPGSPGRAGATSSIASVAIVNALVAQIAENLTAQGITPPILISANVPGGDEHNETIREQYWPRLKATMDRTFRR